MPSDSIETQIESLAAAVREIRAATEQLSEDAFLGPLGNWSPRDVVAHLIGWNRHMARGARQILAGELPFYDVDPGEDWSKVNARLVEEYPSRDREELLEEHEKAARELAELLRSLSDEQWSGRTGVVYEGEELTVRRNVDCLIEDHHHHREQIRALAKDG
jgi:hypothetical protein